MEDLSVLITNKVAKGGWIDREVASSQYLPQSSIIHLSSILSDSDVPSPVLGIERLISQSLILWCWSPSREKKMRRDSYITMLKIESQRNASSLGAQWKEHSNHLDDLFVRIYIEEEVFLRIFCD